VEITSGLAVGEIVVITGNNSLRDGGNVRVVSGPGAATQTRAANAGEGGERGQ
jgi:hypothetical protein